MLKIKDRNGNIVHRDNSQDRLLKWLYSSVSGQFLLKGLTAKTLSSVAGMYCDSIFSQDLIPGFIERSKIDLTEYEPAAYRSFNEFFTRKIRSDCRPIDMDNKAFISPCDCKLSVYKINENSKFNIKDGVYSVASLLKCDRLAKRFCGGCCMIFRLEVDDYHRYIYIDNGIKSRSIRIKGRYHTVNPAALETTDVYKENSREFCVLHTENFGDVIQVEVGAMLVGKIRNHHIEKYSFSRGEEKGMFEFGGSTIVLLTQPGAVEIDSDLIQNTASGFETVVKMGEKIGRKV